MRNWPWFTMIVGAIAAFNPVGLSFLRALGSSEQLSRNIAMPFVLIGALLLAVAGLIEVIVRHRLGRRTKRPAIDSGQGGVDRRG